MNTPKTIMKTPEHNANASTGSRAENALKPTCKRACAACGLKRGPDGVDPCLGVLPGVLAACCGHGAFNGYIAFENGLIVRGRFSEIEQIPAENIVKMRELYRYLR